MHKQESTIEDIYGATTGWLEESRRSAAKSSTLLSTSIATLEEILADLSDNTAHLLTNPETGLQAVLHRAKAAAKSSIIALRSFQKDSETSWNDISESFSRSTSEWRSNVHTAVADMRKECEKLAEDINSACDKWGHEVAVVARRIGTTLADENTRLREESDNLKKRLREINVNEEVQRRELLDGITGLVGRFSHARAQDIASVVEASCNQFSKTWEVGNHASNDLSLSVGDLVSGVSTISSNLCGAVEDVARKAEETEFKLDATSREMTESFEKLSQSQAQFRGSLVDSIERSLVVIQKIAGTEAVKIGASLSQLVESRVTSIRGELESASAGEVSTATSREQHDYLKRLGNEITQEQEILLGKRFRAYASTGMTPRKRSYQWPSDWETLKDPETVLTEFRQSGVPPVRRTPLSPTRIGFSVSDAATNSPLDVWEQSHKPDSSSSDKENTSPIFLPKISSSSPSATSCVSPMDEILEDPLPPSDTLPIDTAPAVAQTAPLLTSAANRQRPNAQPSSHVSAPTIPLVPARPPSASDNQGPAYPSRQAERVQRSRIPAAAHADNASSRLPVAGGGTGLSQTGRLRKR
ncbi:hypothetical protein M427DRAFT_248665 [Gonapodya prolifera JEL478]|uniref:Uncharacterized protein n=1 Tax=Gonapodya prolifera (strain JEL478) TaxID=1344416 RepID=A0A138ZXJ6_GONPJ|nr:hypothetical protein M427DRAFT_248665 [Gonapodya prolifera JEL478]|eukprot:KXS09226.1 hypothetical protein M427DRAFT_248665 [Gonapodya prolifera JEL478]